jgi:MFS family permease
MMADPDRRPDERAPERVGNAPRPDGSYNNNIVTAANFQPGYAYSTLIILGSLAIMVLYAETMLVPALPTIKNEFHVEYSWTAWILSIYLLVGVVATPILGKLGDIFGKKRVLVGAICMYAVGASLAGFSWDFWSLIVFRGFQGFGIAMFPLAFGIARESFPREKVPMAQGIISAMFGVGSSLGLVIGAWITQNYGWRNTYHSIIPIVILLLALIAWRVRESSVRLRVKIDVWGAVTLASGLVVFVVAMTEGTNWGWYSSPILAMIAFSAVMFVVFGWIETKVKDAFVDMKLMKERNILVTNIVIFIIGFQMFMVYQSLAAMVMSPPPVGFSSSITDAGLLQLPSALVQLVLAPLIGILIVKVGMKRPMVAGMFILLAGYLYFYYMLRTPAMYDAVHLMLGISIVSVGMVLGMVGTVNMVLASTPREYTGVSTGMNSLFRMTGGVIGPVVAGVFMTEYTTKITVNPLYHITVSVPSAAAYEYIVLIAAAAAIVSAVAMLFTRDIFLGKERPAGKGDGPAKPGGDAERSSRR